MKAFYGLKEKEKALIAVKEPTSSQLKLLLARYLDLDEKALTYAMALDENETAKRIGYSNVRK